MKNDALLRGCQAFKHQKALKHRKNVGKYYLFKKALVPRQRACKKSLVQKKSHKSIHYSLGARPSKNWVFWFFSENKTLYDIALYILKNFS